MTSNSKNRNYLLHLIPAIGTLIILTLLILFYKKGHFNSVDTLQEFIINFGILAPTVFIFLQTINVIVPIIPASLGSVAGILIFGTLKGLLYNYIGNCTGSIIVFLLSRKYGKDFVRKIIGAKNFEKFLKYIDDEKIKFDRFFTYAIFFPVAPDDILCYIAGLTKMKFKKFVGIILLGKPTSIAIYSIGISAIIQHIYNLVF